MKKIIYFIIMMMVAHCLLSCDSNDYEFVKMDTSEESDFSAYHLNGTSFEYTASDDRSTPAQNVVIREFGTVRYYDDYVYIFNLGNAFRYNPETGNVTNLCSDPLCSHESDECPFYRLVRATGVHISDGKIYYESKREHMNDTGGAVVELYRMRYDIETQTAEVLEIYPFEGSWTGSCYYTNEWRYFIKIDITEEQEEYEVLLRRENLETGDIEILMNFNSISTIVYANEERIYLHDGVNLFYYTIDDIGNAHVISDKCKGYIACDGEWFYHTLKDGENTYLVKYDMEGGNRLTLTEGVSRSYITEQYIYYMPDEMYTVGGDITNYKSDIYRVPKNGGTPELVYTFPEDMIDRYVILYFIVDGNYLYADYGVYTPETDEWHESSNAEPYDVMRINLTTGDIYYISEN